MTTDLDQPTQSFRKTFKLKINNLKIKKKKRFLDRKLPFTPIGGASFVDVRDVAECFVYSMENEIANGKSYLLGAKNCTLYELFQMLEEISGVKKPFLIIPGMIAKSGAKVLDFINRKIKGKWEASVDPVRGEMAASYWWFDSSRAIEEINFKPRNVLTTLRDTIEFINQNREKYGHPAPTKNKIPSKL